MKKRPELAHFVKKTYLIRTHISAGNDITCLKQGDCWYKAMSGNHRDCSIHIERE